MDYYDDEYGKIEIDTPAITNYLPAVGFLGGLFLGMNKFPKRLDRAFATALVGAAIGSIPKFYYATKGAHEAIDKIKEQEAKVNAEMIKQLELPPPNKPISNDTGKKDDNEKNEKDVTTNDIITQLDALSDINEESMANWLPRRTHFYYEIEQLSQRDKNALHDLVYIALLSPPDPTEAQFSKMLLDIEAIDRKFGAEVVERLQGQLDEMSMVLNSEFDKEAVSIAA